VNGEVVNSASNLTGFTANEWQWTSLTMSSTDPTLPLLSTGIYTINLWMREDGLRVDRLLLVTDTNYIPNGVGPDASPVITTTQAQPLYQVAFYTYDGLYRLTKAVYSGTLDAIYTY